MKKQISLQDAVAKIKDGMTLMIGGFLGSGSATTVLDALVESGVKDLTLVSNDSAFDQTAHGKLIANKQVKKIITSYIGANAASIEQMNAGELEVEFSPQGTLAERIRAAGAGLGGVLSPTGLGTMVEKGKQIITVDGNRYILEKPIKADVAILGASISDREGNLYYKGTTRNFNPLMAMAAQVVIVEVEELVETGTIKPEDVHTPAILVDYILIK